MTASGERRPLLERDRELQQLPRLISQHGDIGDALRPVSDRHRQVDQHPSRVVHRPRPAQTREPASPSS